jgi:CubicO group peptidase (beta-lactamase class C family)
MLLAFRSKSKSGFSPGGIAMERSRQPALLLIFACAAAFGLPANPSDKSARIDKLMSQYAECCAFSGSVLVSEHDQVMFRKGYGLANREWKIPNTPDVKFRLGSITKQFTSMLVMQQVEKGAIKLDGHLSDYLPDYRNDTGSRVSIHQLLNHTSGIPSYTDDPKFFPDESRNHYAVDGFVKKFCSGDLQFEPGSKFHYDNSGYFILGAILEHVSGKSYEGLLKEKIFDPLGMKDTGYDHHAGILPKRSSGYELGLGEVINAPYLDMSLPYAAGSLYSTVDDLYKWDQALYTDKLVNAELKKKLFTPGLEQYGYGWVIRTVPEHEAGAGQTVIGHEGGINGFNTLEERLVGDHDLIVLLNNTPNADLGEMAKGIRAILSGQEPAAPKRALAEVLGGTIVHRGADAAVAQYRELKKSNADAYELGEGSLNRLASLLVDNDRIADAIVILKLNAEEFPKASNSYARLAEAYEKSGQKQLAIENYRTAAELDPTDQDTKDKLKELEKN